MAKKLLKIIRQKINLTKFVTVSSCIFNFL